MKSFLCLVVLVGYACAFSCTVGNDGTFCDPANPCKIAQCSNGMLSYITCPATTWCAGTAPSTYCDYIPVGQSCTPSNSSSSSSSSSTTAASSGGSGTSSSSSGSSSSSTTGIVEGQITSGSGGSNGVYQCDAAACAAKNSPGMIRCRCAAPGVPGPFPASDHPMFITVTFDDGFVPSSLDAIQQYFGNPTAVDAAGCNPKGVYFNSQYFTEYSLMEAAKATYGMEIASHTITHTTRENINDWTHEIIWGRKYQSLLTNTPESEIVGFRFPYLVYNDPGLTTIATNGYLYDSSLEDGYNQGVATATDLTWPYTWDYGTPQACNTGENCPIGSHPGLWEIPMADLFDANYNIVALMDPPSAGLYDLLKLNFDRHYNGNRSPLGVYMHLSSATPNLNDIRQWFNYVATFPGVFFVTNKQIIQWMQNMTNIADTITRFKCTPHNVTLGPEICDGLDNNGNGLIDEGVTNHCAYYPPSPSYSFDTCGQCPCVQPDWTVNPYNITTGVPPCNTPATTGTTGSAAPPPASTTGVPPSTFCNGLATGFYCDPANPCKVTVCQNGVASLQNCAAGLVCQSQGSAVYCNYAPPGYTCPA